MHFLGWLAVSCCVVNVQAQSTSQQFKNWDLDRDGNLTIEEVPEVYRKHFNSADTNGDLVVNVDEHRRFNRQFGKLRVHSDLQYVAGGHRRQKLDLYLRQNATEKQKLIVFIHGGGWRNGDKSSAPFELLTRAGFAVASVNYRLSRHDVFPAQIHDCKAAVRWLRKNADRYNLDSSRIGAFGISAGGHLAAMLGTSGEVGSMEGELGVLDYSSRVQAVCNWYGPTQLLTMNTMSRKDSVIDHDARNSPESLLLGGRLQKNRELAKAASPLTYVSNDDPPFLTMHGDQDRLVPVGQSELFHKKLSEVGVQTELEIVRGAGHGFQSRELNRVVRFFRDKLAE